MLNLLNYRLPLLDLPLVERKLEHQEEIKQNQHHLVQIILFLFERVDLKTDLKKVRIEV